MKTDLEARGIRHVWIFGSVARGDQRDDSDIDLVIEISPVSDMTLTGFARLRLDLTDVLGRTVDLTQWHLLEGSALDTARRDAIQVF
jgi:predicted nucleotidyltransferase